MRPARSFILLLLLLTSSRAIGRAEHSLTLAERTLSRIKEPVLHAFANAEKAWNNASAPVFTLLNDAADYTYVREYAAQQNNLLPYYGEAHTPEFRKYQNSHIAPTRMITGGGSIAVGSVMLFEGYRQDTKYPWSGPSMSLSPLNVFGVFIAAVGIGLLVSGLLFYSKFKKHMITPYNKAW